MHITPRSTLLTALFTPLFATLLSAGIAVAAPSKGEKEQTIATVNGVKIPQSYADRFIKDQAAQGVPDSPELRNAIRDELIRREIVAQAAKKQKLHKNPDIAVQLQLSEQAVLIRAYIEDYMEANKISDADVRAEYELAKKQMGNGQEYKTRHILVETEAEAKDIIDKLTLGSKIEDLAKASKDPGSKEKGGDLGWSPATAYVKPFADALMALEKGKFTTKPVKTDFGYHVILLEDQRASQPPGLEAVRDQITRQLQQKQIETLISGLQAKAKIQ